MEPIGKLGEFVFRHIIRKDLNRPIRLGILKGGQLGRMLMQACMNYDLQGYVMDIDPDSPCSHFAKEFVSGDAKSFEDVYAFGKKVDVLTLEVEDVNVDALETLENEGLNIFPQPKIIRLIQDKGLQKMFYKEHDFPTADFVLLEKDSVVDNYAHFLPAVQKLRRAGYDGKGVHSLDSKESFDRAFKEPSILEKKIHFEKEIAVIVARNHDGECAVYPPFELVSDPRKNLLDMLIAPADMSGECQKKAQNLAKEIIKKLGLIGILAVEMFVTDKDKILVNEISPRPHNSGHHTIEANMTSQFEQHLRAIMNLPLGSTHMRSPSVMINILGEPGYKGPPIYDGIEEVLAVPGIFVHLYGKTQTQPFRKMGHVTILEENISRAKEKALWVKEKIRVRA